MTTSISTLIITNGIADANTWFMDIDGGTTLFMVKSNNPNGGVMSPICMAIRNKTPNQIWSMPAVSTKGIKNGSVSSIMLI